MPFLSFFHFISWNPDRRVSSVVLCCVSIMCGCVGVCAVSVPAKRCGDTLGVRACTCAPCAVMHAQHNIISRNIISHIAVMTLGRYVDYTVSKQQPTDWVSILPYITSLHSSQCVFFFFLLASFFQITSHFSGFLGKVAGYTSRWYVDRLGGHNRAAEEKLKPRRAGVAGRNIQVSVLIMLL